MLTIMLPHIKNKNRNPLTFVLSWFIFTIIFFTVTSIYIYTSINLPRIHMQHIAELTAGLNKLTASLQSSID